MGSRKGTQGGGILEERPRRERHKGVWKSEGGTTLQEGDLLSQGLKNA